MGSGKWGLDTVKDVLGVGKHEGWVVDIFYDVWDAPDSTHREQHKLWDVNLEGFIAKYGDWIYEAWYTDGMKRADMWVMAQDGYQYKGKEPEV